MRVAGGILRAEFKRQVPQFEYERSSCGEVARTGWLREVTEGLSFLDCGKSPYLLGKCQGVGLCHYSFTVKLKCHVFFCSTCIIPHGEIHMDNCTTLLVQFWKVENPEIHREQSKRNRVTSQTKKKRFISYRQLGKILACFSVLLLQGLSRFPSARGNLFPPPLDFMHSP